jgi:signal transduction histidine kinase
VDGTARELRAALGREAASREILRVINRSPDDYGPVFDAILERATRLCEAELGLFLLSERDGLRIVAHRGTRPEVAAYYLANPVPLDPEKTAVGRSLAERRPVQVLDLADDPVYRSGFEHRRLAVEVDGARCQVTVPLVQDDEGIGAILIYRREVRAFDAVHEELLTDFAEMAVVALENVRRFKALNHALERQSATSEILRTISQSPTDHGPVFDAILDNASRLCEAPLAFLLMREGGALHFAAHRGSRREFVEFVQANPVPLDDDGALAALAARSATPQQLADITDSDAYRERTSIHRVASADIEGIRTVLFVPMMKGEECVGTIALYRREVRAFDDGHVALVSTLADQAIIAIDNVRLFQALEQRNAALNEALERQTATSEILRAISRSPTDYQPVFNVILENALRLCHAPLGILLLQRGEHLHLVASHGESPGFVEFLKANPFPLARRHGLTARAAIEQVAVQTVDLAAEPRNDADRHRQTGVDVEGIRTLLSVPMLKGNETVGVIALYRREVKAFEGDEVELVSTFADQAVIAIENVRLFQEIRARTAELTKALERQTATSEVLRVISRSQTDYQPVFETILENATRLCGAPFGKLFLVRDEHLHVVASLGGRPEFDEYLRANPLAVNRPSGTTSRAVRERRAVQTVDIARTADELYGSGEEARVKAVDLGGIRTLLAVPLLRGAEVTGVMSLYRQEVLAFEESDVDLVRTFADQAVIAIENVRLFQTVESRSRALAQSVAELEALADVAQAVSSTLDLETVLSTIVERAVQLSGAHAGAIHELDETTGTLPPRAARNVEELLELPAPRLGEGAVGRAAATRAPVQIPDINVPGAYTGALLDALAHLQIRALLAVPLVQDERVLGTLVVARRTPGAFPAETVRLLRALGTQSAIAIRNARLFREIEDKSRQLEAANRHKSEFLANMSHELRTPLNAVIGFSEVLGERMFGDLNDKQAEYVTDIHDSGRHLLSLINDILDLSKIEAGAMELDLGRFALAPALDNALTLVKERAGRRGISLESSFDAELGEMEGDERKLKQILLNLLSNAIKFTAEGGIVTLAAHRDDGAVDIAVHDTGVGISEEDQAVIFEEFRQVGTDYARKVEGTGLGLTLTKRFVEMHGGSITVASAPGEGSTFRVVLPVRVPESAT